MPGIVANIAVGAPITAKWLNAVAETARFGAGLNAEGVPGAPGLPAAAATVQRFCAVTARAVTGALTDGFARLDQVVYTLTVPGYGVVEADWTRRVVDVQRDLIAPGADPVQLFTLAATADEIGSAAEVWRCHGTFYDSPAEINGVRAWYVRLFGEHPARGC